MAHALLVRATWLSYPGGMVLRFTAKVKKREVVVRGVDLPDGSTVNVTIDPQDDISEPDAPHQPDDVWDPTPEEWAMIRQAEAEYRRGEYYRGEDFTAWLRGGPKPVLVRGPARRLSPARAGTATVGSRPRKRAKRTSGRTVKRD